MLNFILHVCVCGSSFCVKSLGVRCSSPVLPLQFQRWGISCFKVEIWLKYCKSNKNPRNNPTKPISDWLYLCAFLPFALPICKHTLSLTTLSDCLYLYHTHLLSYWFVSPDPHFLIAFTCVIHVPSSLAKVPIRFPPLPLGRFRQVFKLSANMRSTSPASNI